MQTLDPAGHFQYFLRLSGQIRTNKPALEPNFADLVQGLGGPLVLGSTGLDALARLVMGTEHIFIPPQPVWLAWQHQELELFSQALVGLHKGGPASAGAFLGLYPKLGHPLSEIQSALMEYALSPGPAGDPRARLLAWAFAFPDATHRRDILKGFAKVATSSPGILGSLAENLDRHFVSRSSGQVHAWLKRGFSLVAGGRTEEGSDFLCLHSRESRSHLGMGGAILREEQAILRIYSASIRSRSLNVLPVELSSFLLSRPYTDGNSVFLPPQISVFGSSESNRRAYSALTALLAGLASEETFGFQPDKALSYRLADAFGSLLPDFETGIREEWGTRLKILRERSGNILELVLSNDKTFQVLETPLEKFFYSFPAPLFARKIFGLLETSRVEWQLSQNYAGLNADFGMIKSVMRRIIPKAASVPGPKNEKPGTGTGGANLQPLFRQGVRRLLELRVESEPSGVPTLSPGESAPPAVLSLSPQGQSFLDSLTRTFSKIRRKDAKVADSASLTLEIYQSFFDLFPLSAYIKENQDLCSWEFPLDPQIEPAIVADQCPALVPARTQREEIVFEDEEKSVDITSRRESGTKAPDPVAQGIRDGTIQVFKYPEFDLNRGSWLRKHCTILQRQVPLHRREWYDGVLNEHRRIQTSITKKFQMMQPEEVELTRRWVDGDEVHLGDAVDFAVDLARGASGDDRVYMRKTVNVRDVALQLLVDASSSTLGEVNGRSIIDTEQTALVILSSALHKIGDDFSIAAWNSNGPGQVNYWIAKDFNDPWTPACKSRIARISPYGANRDGCAIRHSTRRLQDLPHKTKVLLILSDGIPADRDYGESDGTFTTDYAQEDTRRAILECRKAGIVPFCLTIDTSAKSYISHLYGDYSFSVLADISQLPQRLARLYMKLTR